MLRGVEDFFRRIRVQIIGRGNECKQQMDEEKRTLGQTLRAATFSNSASLSRINTNQYRYLSYLPVYLDNRDNSNRFLNTYLQACIFSHQGQPDPPSPGHCEKSSPGRSEVKHCVLVLVCNAMRSLSRLVPSLKAAGTLHLMQSSTVLFRGAYPIQSNCSVRS